MRRRKDALESHVEVKAAVRMATSRLARRRRRQLKPFRQAGAPPRRRSRSSWTTVAASRSTCTKAGSSGRRSGAARGAAGTCSASRNSRVLGIAAPPRPAPAPPRTAAARLLAYSIAGGAAAQPCQGRPGVGTANTSLAARLCDTPLNRRQSWSLIS